MQHQHDFYILTNGDYLIALRANVLFCIICREFPTVADWSLLTCQLNNRASANTTDMLFPVRVSSVRPSEFLCPYETHCFALCMCCDFFACDCRMKCSDGCNCFHDQVSTYYLLLIFRTERGAVASAQCILTTNNSDDNIGN